MCYFLDAGHRRHLRGAGLRLVFARRGRQCD
jgi:hypothetical protein